MARINSILQIMVQQRGTELRMGTGRIPKLFREGSPLRFMMPETSEETLRGLLGETLLSEEHEAQLQADGRCTFAYAAEALGSFEVDLTLRRARAPEDDPDGLPTGAVIGFEVTFRREPTPAPTEEEPPARASAPQAPAEASALRWEPGEAAEAPEAPRLEAPQPAALPRDTAPVASEELRALLTLAVQRRASDLHLSADEAPTLRIDGQLTPLVDEPRVIPELVLAGCLTPRVRALLAQGEAGDLALELPTVGRFRMNIYASSRGLSAAVRVLARGVPRLSELQLPAPLEDLAELGHGLVLVVGATGSGKSTTLAAIAQEALLRRSILLVSLEDPIEYLLKPGRSALVRQRQIGVHARSFTTGLRDALREDPDVILIGEMRDTETISLALTAAETGHLVLASLHSRSAAGAVERIVDSYPGERQAQLRTQLAESLSAIVAQRLLPRANGQGGRVVAAEVLRNTHSVASLIREGRTAQLASALQAGRAEGMLPMERCLADLVHAFKITPEDARRACNDPAVLQSYLRA